MSTLATRDAGLKIAMLAPPWLPIPPPGYGGIESVIDSLCHALVGRGHDVALFAAPGSEAACPVHTVLDLPPPHEIGKAMHEARHVSGALALIDREGELGRPFDVIHDHNEAVTVAFADRIAVPVVHTVHGPFTAEARDLYARNTAALLVGSAGRSSRPRHPRRRLRRDRQPARRRRLALRRARRRSPCGSAASPRRRVRTSRSAAGAPRAAASRSGRPGPARPGGVLRSRDRAAHRRRAGPLRRRGRWRGRTSSSRGPTRCSCRSAGRTVRDGHDRGHGMRNAGDRLR